MSVADALRMMNAGLDYLNGPGAAELDAGACGLVLHPDGTTTAYGLDGQVLHSHSPPTLRAG